MRRRTFVRGLSTVLAATPLLPALEATAEPGPSRKRFIVFATPNGTAMDAFWSGSQQEPGHILQPLQPYLDRSVVMRGVDMKCTDKPQVPPNHDPDNFSMLTASQPFWQENVGSFISAPSLDHVIGRALIDEHGVATPYAYLNLGIFTGTGHFQYISGTGPYEPNAASSDPVEVWNRLFADLDADPAELAALRARRQTVIDAVSGDLAALEQRLGCDDRQRLGAHLDAMRELEHRVQSLTNACTQPAVPPAELSQREHDRFPEVGRVQMDLLVSALACDLTRVVTLQWDGGASDIRHFWANPAIYRGHHSIAHEDNGDGEAVRQGWLADIDRWYCEQLVYLCDRLANTIDIDGTPLLDHTVILWAHEQSHGGYHGRRDMPYVLVGDCEGALATGQALDYGGRYAPGSPDNVPGKAHGGLLATIAEAMGVHLDTFGDPAYWEGHFEELLA